MDLWVAAIESFNNVCSWSFFRACCAAAVAVFSYTAGLAHPSIPFLIALVCIDFVLAAGIAFFEGSFTWPGFLRGLGKFMSYAMIFIVTTITDYGLGINTWPLNFTVAVSCYGISGESISALQHIDHIFPGHLPVWLISRLRAIRTNMEKDTGSIKGGWYQSFTPPMDMGESGGVFPFGNIPEDNDDHEKKDKP